MGDKSKAKLGRSENATSLSETGRPCPQHLACDWHSLTTRQQQSGPPSGASWPYDVYVPGHYLYQAISQLPATSAGQPVQVHRFFMSNDWVGPSRSRDWTIHLLSLTKIVEIVLLVKFGSPMIGVATSLPWAYSFVMAVLLQVYQVGRGFEKSHPTGTVDILYGDIPTQFKGGAGARILLDVPYNFRNHILWSITWAISAVVCVASLILLYANLRRATPIAILIWLSFQLLWLFIRSALYQVLDAADTEYVSSSPGKHINTIQPGTDEHERVLDLMHAHLFTQQHHNIRESTELKDPRQSSRVLATAAFSAHTSFPARLLPADGGEVGITIHSIIGDSLLRSGGWLQGITLCGIEPNEKEGVHSYDSAMLILSDGQGNLSAYPVVRAGCGPDQSQTVASASPTIAEVGGTIVRQLYPRGAGSVVPERGPSVRHRWFYWLPCSDGRWMQIWWHFDEQPASGQVSIITDDDFTRLLESQTLQIGEWSVTEARKGVESSKSLFQALYRLLIGRDILMQ